MTNYFGIWDLEIGISFCKAKSMDCYFCKRNLKEIDWKDQKSLKRFLTGLGKIRKRERTELCARHQRKLSQAVKRARHLGVLSATSK